MLQFVLRHSGLRPSQKTWNWGLSVQCLVFYIIRYFDLFNVKVRPGQTGLLVSQQARPGGQTLTVQRPAQQHMNIVGANTIAGRQGIRQQVNYALI